jgi:hypothetical protein
MFSIDILRGYHKGETIAVVGTSSSLNEIDLELLTKFTMIGTNDALGRFVTKGLRVPDYLLTAEVGSTQRAMMDLKEHDETVLLTRRRVAYHARDHEDYNGRIYTYDLKANPAAPSERGPLHQVNNTAHYAVQIAARFQDYTPAQIVLAGVDLRYPTDQEKAEGKENHYWGDGTIDGCRPAFDGAIKFFPQLKSWLSARGIQLVTVSPWDGPLTKHIPRVRLEDLVQ